MINTHTNMGYDFRAVDFGLEMEPGTPASDLEMVQETMADYLPYEPFHAYYMTYSGHSDYDFETNSMSIKNQELVAELPYSEQVKAYIACQLELEQAMAYMIDRLEQTGQGTMVGYRLMNTVSDHGTVSRGVCQTENGSLKKVKETLKIKKYPDGSIADIADPENEVPLAPESPVSMNFWGFTPWIFEEMEAYFTSFLQGLAPDELKAECLLPVLVDKLITGGKLNVSVLDTDAVWFGVTYKEDRPIVEAELKKLHESGAYPASLKN